MAPGPGPSGGGAFGAGVLERLGMQEIPFSDYLDLLHAEGPDRPDAAAQAIHSSEYFTSPEWFRLLVETCLSNREEAVVHRLKADGRAAGSSAPVDIPLTRAPLSFGPLRGQELRGLSNFYSCYYRPRGLTRGPESRHAVAQWARALGAQRQPPDRLMFRALDARDGTLAVLEQGLHQAECFWVERFPDFGNWYLSCAGLAFADYWQERPGRLRSTVQRKLKALQREAALEILRLDRPQDAEAAIRYYSAVQARAWQPPEPHEAFIPELIRRGLAAGSLQLWMLIADGRPVAAQIWTLHGREATVFKLAYDNDWKARSPGTLLTHAAMKRALEEGAFDRIDFGRGDDSYKQQWTPERDQRWGLAAYSRRTLLGTILAMRNLVPARLRALAAKLRAAPPSR